MTDVNLAAAPPPRRSRSAAPSSERLVTVTDLAADLGITPRALRFYEDQKLITPQRVGATRVYSHRERARMIMILRGKALGFSIREIKDYLDLYDADPKHETQTRALLTKIAERRRQLHEKRLAIEQALDGLDDLERDAEALLVKNGIRRARRDSAKAARANAASPRAALPTVSPSTISED